MLCIGDLMLDDFVYGEVSRISPEAPAPVIRVGREEIIVGGAGNVARNIASLGAKCLFVGVIGDDVDRARSCARELKREQGASPRIWWSIGSRPTTRKLRFVSEHFSTHLLRADWEIARPVDAKIEAALIQQALKLHAEGRRGGAVRLRQGRADAAADPRGDRARAGSFGKPVIVDPKGADYLDLSRRHRHHAEPQGTGRGDAAGRSAATRSSRAAARALAQQVGSRGRAGDAERRRHDAATGRAAGRSMCRPIR